jgi:hypothetical protein
MQTPEYVFTKNKIQPRMAVQACNPSYSGGRAKRIRSWRPTPGKFRETRPYLKKKKKAEGVAYVVECLPNISKVLCSIPRKKKIKNPPMTKLKTSPMKRWLNHNDQEMLTKTAMRY